MKLIYFVQYFFPEKAAGLQLVKDLLDSASKGVVVFEPKIEGFYLTEIEDFIKKEYDNRLNVLRIPYTIDLKSRVMINSDKEGITRMLTQLMENAIKYGDGKQIHIGIESYYRQE